MNETNKHYEAIGREASHAKGKRMGGYRAREHYTERNGRKTPPSVFFSVDAGSRCDVVLSTLSAHALQTQGNLLATS